MAGAIVADYLVVGAGAAGMAFTDALLDHAERIQSDGPEKGLHERATAPEVCAYYTQVLERLTPVKATSARRGSSRSTRFRLFCRAPARSRRAQRPWRRSRP
jgi:hypothetical protein